MNKNDMQKIVDAYAKAKAEEKTIKANIEELALEIKSYFDERGIVEFVTDNATAKIGTRETKNLDKAKIAKHFGGTIPAEYFTVSTSAVLTVKEVKKGAAVAAAIGAA